MLTATWEGPSYRPHSHSIACEEPSLLPGLLIWAAFEELIAHHSNAGQEDTVLLEVHLVVPVAVQVAHQLLKSSFIRPFLKAEEATG